MKADEYMRKLAFFANRMENSRGDCRRESEYRRYLKRWFSNEECDGFKNFHDRITAMALPMAENIYFS